MRIMSYLENIKKDGKYANPFFCLMGIDVVSVEPGKAVLNMQVRPDMHNGVGWLQGGMLSRTEGIATISESTSFIRGIQEGFIIAEGRVIRKGRRVAFAEGEVFVDNDEKTLLSRTSAAFAVTTSKN
jgi:acyl-CoA thioesterase